MPPSKVYQQKIIDYYSETENAYRDSWDLDKSLAIHYGFWDENVKTFSGSLLRMNEVMAEAAVTTPGEFVLDAGCGVGGSSIFLAEKMDCKVIGISLSRKQVEKAIKFSNEKGVNKKVEYAVMNFNQTSFPDNYFDVVWGCESICYSENKNEFIREAFRILKPGGRIVIADGFVTDFTNNMNPVIQTWLEGWQVNYLESPERFQKFMHEAGFRNINYRNISKETFHSARRLYKYYFLGSLYLLWKKINFSKPATKMQKANIRACKFQYLGMKKLLWQYGLVMGKKPQ